MRLTQSFLWCLLPLTALAAPSAADSEHNPCSERGLALVKIWRSPGLPCIQFWKCTSKTKGVIDETYTVNDPVGTSCCTEVLKALPVSILPGTCKDDGKCVPDSNPLNGGLLPVVGCITGVATGVVKSAVARV